MSWPETGLSSPPQSPPPGTRRARIAGIMGVFLIVGGAGAIAGALLSQQHAPQPSTAAAGVTGTSGHGPSLPRSIPVAINIPAIDVNSKLLHLGLNPGGTIQVPPLTGKADLAAWYKNSVTPGEIGTSVIEGHVDTYAGPAVFFRLGALKPGDTIDVTLTDGDTAIFRVTGIREYLKENFPDKTIYGSTDFAALRLITCGGAFDYATRHYLGSTVVFASLTSYRDHARPGKHG
ncbi:MAG: class F sortase [Trebonia sp.]